MIVTKITKWGNSLGIRIPGSIASQIKITEGTEVELCVKNDVLEITRKNHLLGDLLAQITLKNRHNEIDWGDPEGGELF